MSDQLATLRKREEALHGIIELLEGEVRSTEQRLERLAASRPRSSFPPPSELADVDPNTGRSPVDPQLRSENERLRNELAKHDDQLAELLGEIGILSQELEIMRGERSQLRAEVERLGNGAAPALAAWRTRTPDFAASREIREGEGAGVAAGREGWEYVARRG